MAVRIRLTRKGTHKKPFYRIVAAESRMPRDGRFLDIIGTYDPLQNPAVIKIDEEMLSKYLADGALPSETAMQLIKKSGVLNKSEAATA